MPDIITDEPQSIAPQLILSDASDFILSRWVLDSSAMAKIMSSIPSAPANLMLDKANCFTVGDKVLVAHEAGDCGGGLWGCGTIATIAGETIGVTMADGSVTVDSGGANGIVARTRNLQGWIGILAIYSHFPQEPSPAGLEGSIDKGSNQLLLLGDAAVSPGDKLWLPMAGITGARVLSVQRGKKKNQDYTIASLSQLATKAIAPSDPASVTRRGQLLAYAKLKPSGDGTCGLMEGYIDRRDIVALPSAESCGCDPCAPTREVGCYQFIVAQGTFGDQPGYQMYYANQQFVAETGKVYVQQSIANELMSLKLV